MGDAVGNALTLRAEIGGAQRDVDCIRGQRLSVIRSDVIVCPPVAVFPGRQGYGRWWLVMLRSDTPNAAASLCSNGE